MLMSLPTRNLDDRTFQDIVDEAKRRIAASCPAWTDHNVSDPGITLVELFAWMTEMVLYRLNQVPEKNYVKFMELLGLRLQEAETARTEVTFYLASPQEQVITIPKGSEVATVRTEARPSIVFSTDEDLEVHAPEMVALITRSMGGEGGKRGYHQQNLKQLGVTGFQFRAFGEPPQVDDALYFGFENDLSHHVLGLEMTCETAVGMGIDTSNPPWQWEVWFGGEGDDRWRPAVVEEDGTGGMNQPGVIRLRLPKMAQREFRDKRAYWARCRVVEPEIKGTNYEKSPRLRNVVAKSWGGTVWATHASIVRGEILGRSDGSPGQRFQVEHAPLLRRLEGETVEVRPPGEENWEAWIEVSDFSDSTALDKHFTCDSNTGGVAFGPALRLPDGAVRSYGAIPPRGAEVRFSAYRHGGGVAGNLQAGTLTVLKTSIPYVDRVTSHVDATGGLDTETIELAQIRAPQELRSRGRAVTSSDYEALARKADPRVYRARCIQPLSGGNGGPGAGQIFLLLVPRLHQVERRLALDELRIGDDLRKTVARYLDDYRLLTVRLDIREPEYVWVGVDVTVSAAAEADPKRVRAEVERQLYRYFNPITGGPAGDGWPFGRDLYPSDVYACLQPVRGIEFIETLTVYLAPPGGERKEVSGRLAVPAHGLVASADHEVKVH